MARPAGFEPAAYGFEVLNFDERKKSWLQIVDYLIDFNGVFGFVCFSLKTFDLDGHNLGTVRHEGAPIPYSILGTLSYMDFSDLFTDLSIHRPHYEYNQNLRKVPSPFQSDTIYFDIHDSRWRLHAALWISPPACWCSHPGEGAGRYIKTILDRAVMQLKWDGKLDLGGLKDSRVGAVEAVSAF